MDHLLPPGIIDEFSNEDLVDMSVYVDDCACQCRSHITVQDGLLNVHGRPIFDRLLVRGSLTLTGDQDIRRLPDFLAVTGSVHLTGCTKLEVLPSRMYAGDLIRMEETNVRDLPGTFVAGRAIHIDRCPNVRRIPPGVRTGTFQAAGCTKLTEVAPGLELNTLDLSGTPMVELPADLTIKSDLKLRDCARLSQIPEGVTVQGGIDVRGCDMLFTLPRSIQPRVAVTDGMMLAHDWVVVPPLPAEEASMCLGVKGIQAFPHRHFKNLQAMQDVVVSLDRQGRGIGLGRALATLRPGAKKRPPPRHQLFGMSMRLEKRRPLLINSEDEPEA